MPAKFRINQFEVVLGDDLEWQCEDKLLLRVLNTIRKLVIEGLPTSCPDRHGELVKITMKKFNAELLEYAPPADIDEDDDGVIF